MDYDENDSVGCGVLLIFVVLIVGFWGLIHRYSKSSTAKKYDEYIELKKEKEEDSIKKLHYKWNKDLDNKIKKLKDE